MHISKADRCPYCKEYVYCGDLWGECPKHANPMDHLNICDSYAQHVCHQRFLLQAKWIPDLSNPSQLPWKCETCRDTFHTQAQAIEHINTMDHYYAYCKDCNLHFLDKVHLISHLTTRMHRGEHRTRALCVSGVNRIEEILDSQEKIDNFIATHPWSDDEDEENNESSSFAVGRIFYQSAFNGRYWECFLCHKFFRGQGALDAHLESPAHSQGQLRCPNLLYNKEFESWPMVLNHLQNAICGMAAFEHDPVRQNELEFDLMRRERTA